MKPENCALFILASGLSIRFGVEDKLMADLGGKPVLSHVIDTAAPVPFAARFGIIPKTSIKRRALFESEGYDLIENATPEQGQGSSLILAAIKAMSQNYEAICILLGDMPFVPSAHLRSLIDMLYDKEMVISTCNNTTLPPISLRGSKVSMLLKINPKGGAKQLFESANSAHLPLSKRAAQDIDRPENLAWLNAQLGV